VVPVQVVLGGAESQVVSQDGQTGAEVSPLDQLPQRTAFLHHGAELLTCRACQDARVQQHLPGAAGGGRLFNGYFYQKLFHPQLLQLLPILTSALKFPPVAHLPVSSTSNYYTTTLTIEHVSITTL